MTKIRYKTIKNTVNNLFLSLSISSYPINIMEIFSYFDNCRVISYKTHMKKYGLSKTETIRHLGSDEGCIIYDNIKKRYLIFYNNLNINYKSPARIRWTLAHELGHVLLKHHLLTNKTKLFRGNLSKEEYSWLEAEANRFASLLLANPIILHQLKIKNPLQIMDVCKVSKEASQYRYEAYLSWKKSKYTNSQDKAVLLQFYNFIHQKKCTTCNHSFISEDAIYCPICGGNTLEWGGTNMKYKDDIPTNEDGQALICPRCGNEEIKKQDLYCKICGGYIIQKCSGISYGEHGEEYYTEPCRIILESNARHCTQCGCLSTFYENDYLENWQKEKKELEINELKQRNNTLKLSKAFVSVNGEPQEAKVQINKIVREIDKCIALLNR